VTPLPGQRLGSVSWPLREAPQLFTGARFAVRRGIAAAHRATACWLI
jgi:hypothetical protein